MQFVRFCLFGVVLVSLAGCFQVSTVVRVNPDGSGVVEERMLFSRKLLAQLEGMFQGMAPEGGEKPKPMELFEPDKLKQAAQQMGEGVSYRSGRKIVTDDYEGYQVEYAFTDINKLRLQQKTKPSLGEGGQEQAAPPFDFRFSKAGKGTPATLTIRQPSTPAETAATPPVSPASQPAAGAGDPDDPQVKALTDMMRGLRFTLAVEVNGTIASTNATHRDGASLTLVDMDFDKLAGGMGQLAGLGGANAGTMTMDQARALLKDVPGMKVDMNDELTVSFR